MDEIKRLFERYLCKKLSYEITGHKFLSMNGGNEEGGDELADAESEDLEPPFTVVSVNEAQKMMAQFGHWRVQGTVQLVTHIDEMTPVVHSKFARLIYHVLVNLQPEVVDGLAFHGIDVTDSRSVDTSEQSARVDVIEFTAGIGG